MNLALRTQPTDNSLICEMSSVMHIYYDFPAIGKRIEKHGQNSDLEWPSCYPIPRKHLDFLFVRKVKVLLLKTISQLNETIANVQDIGK